MGVWVEIWRDNPRSGGPVGITSRVSPWLPRLRCAVSLTAPARRPNSRARWPLGAGIGAIGRGWLWASDGPFGFVSGEVRSSRHAQGSCEGGFHKFCFTKTSWLSRTDGNSIAPGRQALPLWRWMQTKMRY